MSDDIYKIYLKFRRLGVGPKFYDFMNEQINEINKHKWIESEKACKDLGEKAVYDWIVKFALSFREHWEKKYGVLIKE